MRRKTCLMHVNCQGEGLIHLLEGSQAFSRRYRILQRINYLHEPISDEDMAGCDLLLYQYLGPKWGDLSTENLLRRLPPSAVALCIPNPFFKAYWPFWTNKTPMAGFGDTLLDRLLDEGIEKPVIMRLCLTSDITRFANLQAILEQTMNREYRKEERYVVKTMDFFLERWKQRPMLHTVNHPVREFLVYIVQGILRALAFPPLSEEEIRRVTERPDFLYYENFDLPINPQVAAFYGLDFAGTDATFAVFGRRMTYAQYISRYIDCRVNGYEKDFLGYLHLV